MTTSVTLTPIFCLAYNMKFAATAFAALVATAAALAPLNMMDNAIEDNYIVVFKKTA